MFRTLTTFKTADDKPIVSKNFDKAVSVAVANLNMKDIETKDEGDIIEELANGKRKRRPISNGPTASTSNLHPVKKRAIKRQQQVFNQSTSITSPTKQSDFDEDSDSINWSGDEDFLSNVSVLDQSNVSLIPIPTKVATVKQEPKSNGEPTSPATLAASTSDNTVDEEIEWDDDADAEISRLFTENNLDTSINISTSKLDRSALQEISNFSCSD